VKAFTLTALAGVTAVALLLWVTFALIVADGPQVRFYSIPSSSMQPALMPGDYVTVHFFAGGGERSVRRGEIVAYASSTDEFATYVKRVVGLPGDTLAMIHGALQLNGRRMPEAYAWNGDTTDDPGDADFDWQRKYVVGPPSHDTAHYTPSRDNWGPIALPPGEYFVLGDNRDNSNDSRYGGFVPARNILGEPRRVYFSRDSSSGIRWSRFGRRIR
jgi:signal peptidase I